MTPSMSQVIPMLLRCLLLCIVCYVVQYMLLARYEYSVPQFTSNIYRVLEQASNYSRLGHEETSKREEMDVYMETVNNRVLEQASNYSRLGHEEILKGEEMDVYMETVNNRVLEQASNYSRLGHEEISKREEIDLSHYMETVNNTKILNQELDGALVLEQASNYSRLGHEEILKGEEMDVYMETVNYTNIFDQELNMAHLARKHYSKRYRRVTSVDCSAVFNNDRGEIRRARHLHIETIKVDRYAKMTANCATFIRGRGYIMHHLTEEEKNFPIAYSILMYKYVEQTERLLRSIYRPQNIYCIHVDAKTNNNVYRAMSSVANCFNNVFLTSKRILVTWGEMSVLEPELVCMEELWKRSKTWKYFINLTGQEFPIRTNYELVKILNAYNGANDVEATRERNQKRWENAPPPPYGIIPTKGAVHIAVQRGFVDFVLHDQRARAILEWTNLTVIPDETFFSTLNHNPHLLVPGSYTGYPETTESLNKIKPYLARFKNRGKYIYNWRCTGKRIRGMCVLGLGDLTIIKNRKELFANKFHLDFQAYAYECIEELHFNRTRDEYLGKLKFDAKWYNSLGFVKNQVV